MASSWMDLQSPDLPCLPFCACLSVPACLCLAAHMFACVSVCAAGFCMVYVTVPVYVSMRNHACLLVL